MPIRQPKIKDQAALLRKHLAAKGLVLAQGESLELAATLNGFASWNVAKQAQTPPAPLPVKDETTVPIKVWPALHSHRHGEDVFLFQHQPDEDEVIDAISSASSYEPHEGESIEVLAAQTVKVDLPRVLLEQASSCLSNMVRVYEVNMTDHLDYEDPQTVAQWKWVQSLSAFNHVGNGSEPGVWEFMVHASKLKPALEDESVPKELRNEVQKAMGLGATWVMFHQG